MLYLHYPHPSTWSLSLLGGLRLAHCHYLYVHMPKHLITYTSMYLNGSNAHASSRSRPGSGLHPPITVQREAGSGGPRQKI
jgi:hypothetical protein